MYNKEDELKVIENEIKKCVKCRLYLSRTNPVVGEGDVNSTIMFIGEAPGKNEDIQGRPFVGAAGKILTELISSIGLSRKDVYITNVVKCRPPGNRDPRPDEINMCSTYLDRQIKIIRPKIIVTLGRHSTRYILSKIGRNIDSISKVRGRTFKIKLFNINIILIPTYHPAAALYNPMIKNILLKDFNKIKSIYRDSEQSTLDKFLGRKDE